MRTILAAILVAAVVRPRLAGRSGRDIAVGVAFGLNLAVMNLSFYQSAARMPRGAAVTLEFIGPLGLAVLMSRRPLDLIWVLLAGTGVVLLSEGGLNGLDLAGAAFAIGAGVCWACSILVGAQAGRRFPGADGLAVALLVSSAAILPLAAVTTSTAAFEPTTFLLGCCVAILCSALPFSLGFAALRHLPARTFGMRMSLEPAGGTVAGFLVLGQRLSG